jgi:hypothetical protein
MVMVPVISGPTLECLRRWRRLSSFMYLSMPSRSLVKDASSTSILEKRATRCGRCLEGMIVTWVSLSSFWPGHGSRSECGECVCTKAARPIPASHAGMPGFLHDCAPSSPPSSSLTAGFCLARASIISATTSAFARLDSSSAGLVRVSRPPNSQSSCRSRINVEMSWVVLI